MVEEIVGIPSMWSFWSMVSGCSIVWAIICFMGFRGGTVKGIVWNCTLLTIISVAHICLDSKSASGFARSNGHPLYQPRVFSSEYSAIGAGKKSVFFWELMGDGGYAVDGVAYDVDYQVYSMHDPTSPDYMCNWKVFHPAGFIYWSVIFSLPVIMGGAWGSKKFGK